METRLNGRHYKIIQPTHSVIKLIHYYFEINKMNLIIPEIGFGNVINFVCMK